MVRRLQIFCWWIGGFFCDSDVVKKQQDADRALAEDVRLLRQHQAEDRRKLEEQAAKIDVTAAHIADCHQDRLDLREQMDARSQEYVRMMQLYLAGKEEPEIHLLEGQG